MKVQGRYIVILAVLGLFMALIPFATAGAATGVVTLTGGEKGQFYSDKCANAQECFNIVTIEVEDTDLSPLRFGKGRAGLDDPGNLAFGKANYLSLGDLVIEGELSKTDRFDGGPSNPVCVDTDSDDIADRPAVDSDTLTADQETACASDGDAVLGDGDDQASTNNFIDDTATDEDEAANNTYTFTLKETARDANEDGVVDADDFTVMVNNSTLKDERTITEPGYFVVTLDTGTTAGRGATHVVIHGKVPNNDIGDARSVVITYEYSEYDFVGATTPLNIAGSRVFHGPDREDLDEIGVDGVDSTAHELRIPLTTVDDAGEITFAYHVKDEPEKLVTVSSSSSQGTSDVTLDGVETGVRTAIFKSTAALVSDREFDLMDTASDEVDLLDDGAGEGDPVVSVMELSTSDTLDSARVLLLATQLGMATGDPAKDLVARLLPVSHEDTITVTYADKDVRGLSTGSIVKTAEVDMEAPVVTLVRPADKLYTKESTVTLQAEVVDTGAGVDQGDIVLVATAGVNLPGQQDQLKSPVASGFSVTGVPTAGIGEGAQKWAVLVTDKVGNTPVEDVVDADDCLPGSSGEDCDKGAGPIGVNEAARGAAGPETAIGQVDNPFVFTVDTEGPTLDNGKTGFSLKNAGVSSGESKESENKNKRDWVRVTFELGLGTAPIDPATVDANDFRVDGEVPVEAAVNSVAQDCNDAGKECKIAKGSAVYLKVAQLDTDARPKVELSGEIRDRSGNLRTGGSVNALADGLNPVLTVNTSEDISDSEVVITVSSSERLSGRPTVRLTETAPDDGVAEDTLGNPLAVVLQQGGTTSWEAEKSVVGNQAIKYYVVVEGKDPAGNTAKVGDDKPADDVVSFQLDSQAPTLVFKSASGKDLDDSKAKPKEGAVWIVGEFDEDEHADDKFRKVNVTAVTLTNLDTEEVDDRAILSMLFGGEVACDDHAAEEDADPVPQSKCAQHTLAINLMPGMYNIEMTGVDRVGNSVTEDVDFEVTETEPFELELKPGQNFISIPGMPMGDGGNINTLLADEAITSIRTYDASRGLQGQNPWLGASKDLETGMFVGDEITTIEPGKAYFINSDANVTVEIRLQAGDDLPPTIPVRQGYNAIGFWSVSGEASAELDLYLGGIGWTVAYTYDPTPGVYWQVLRKDALDEDGLPLNKVEAGVGYLVYALYDSTLTP